MAESPEANTNERPMAARPCKRCGNEYHEHTAMGHTLYCKRCCDIRNLGIKKAAKDDGFHFGTE